MMSNLIVLTSGRTINYDNVAHTEWIERPRIGRQPHQFVRVHFAVPGAENRKTTPATSQTPAVTTTSRSLVYVDLDKNESHELMRKLRSPKND